MNHQQLKVAEGTNLVDLMSREGQLKEFPRIEGLIRLALFSNLCLRRKLAQRKLDDFFGRIVDLELISDGDSSRVYIGFNFSDVYFLVGSYSGPPLIRDSKITRDEERHWQSAYYRDN